MNNLEVPTNADFAIEGYVDPREPLRGGGPFGDHTDYCTLPSRISSSTSPPSLTAKPPSFPP